jgi:hypothetical protein
MSRFLLATRSLNRPDLAESGCFHLARRAYSLQTGEFMKIRLFFGAAIVFFLPCFACESGKTYPVTFVCEPTGGLTCPPEGECPALPLGSDTCGDLPGLFGHPPTSVTVGRPVGCEVGLSYGNPYYGDSQQTCTCTMDSSSPTPKWECPV